MILTSQIVRPLVLEWLSKNATGTVQSVVSGVMDLAFQKKLVDIAYLRDQPAHDRTVLFDHVQTVMWQLLPQSILVWGLTDHSYGVPKNDSYPFYRLTEYGKKGVIDSGSKPQPYDPDGFLAEFKRLVPEADSIVVEYLEEAVRAFNAACYKSAAVMLGAASEKMTLTLYDKFEQSITDTSKRTKFAKDSDVISASRKFDALKERLDLMDRAKKFKDHHELRGTIRHDLPSVSELVRRCRNDAGHPDIPTQTDPDTVFLTLRVFAEHARKVYALLRYFDTNAADW